MGDRALPGGRPCPSALGWLVPGARVSGSRPGVTCSGRSRRAACACACDAAARGGHVGTAPPAADTCGHRCVSIVLSGHPQKGREQGTHPLGCQPRKGRPVTLWSVRTPLADGPVRGDEPGEGGGQEATEPILPGSRDPGAPGVGLGQQGAAGHPSPAQDPRLSR